MKSLKPKSSRGTHDGNTRGSRVSLAAYGREKFPPHIYYAWHKKLLQNEKPLLVKVDQCEEEGCNCGLAIGGEPNVQPTIDQMQLSVARIMERTHGQPQQNSKLEVEVQGEVRHIADNSQYLRNLDGPALQALGEILSGKKALPVKSELEEVQDAELANEEKLE